MSEKQGETYQMIYFTTPFCGVCKSAQPLVRMLAMSLEVSFLTQNLHTFVNNYEGLIISVTPSVALVYNKKVIYYTERVNNLSDLYRRFLDAKNTFEKEKKTFQYF